jgi:hypothetical protein
MYILKSPGRPKRNAPYISPKSKNREWKSFKFESIDNPDEVLIRTKLLIEKRICK